MSFMCTQHGWQHLLKACPSCVTTTTTNSSSSGTTVHSNAVRIAKKFLDTPEHLRHAHRMWVIDMSLLAEAVIRLSEENDKIKNACAASLAWQSQALKEAEYSMELFIREFECEQECQCCLNNRAQLIELKEWLVKYSTSNA